MNTKAERKVISFFSGGMGLDIGLTQAGLSVVIGQDFDRRCCETIRANGHSVIEGDIRQIQAEDILMAADMRPGEAFLVCGGPPCQPFSTAGKRLGINDPRGSLFMDYIRMIDTIRPRFFLMENVKGLISAPLRSDDTYGPGFETVLDVVLSEFSRLGYRTVYGVLDAVHYGVPQFRERLILLGSRDGEDVFLPVPTHFPKHQESEYRWRTIRRAWEGLEDDGECGSFSPERLYYLRMVPEGGNWRDLPPEFQEKAMGGAYHSGGGKVGFYRRLSYDSPSPTVTTAPAQKATMLCHPVEDRPLSVREYARLQEFPDEWIFSGSTAEKYKQIGNAVPVGLARAIGQAIIATADGNAEVQTKRFRGTSAHDRFLV